MIVYYADQLNNLLMPPRHVLSMLGDDSLFNAARIHRCPAFADYYKNVFAISATFDYTLKYNKVACSLNSDDYGQDYFDDHVLMRDLNVGIFSYTEPKLYLVPDTDSLVVEQMGLMYPFEAPEYTVVPGMYDVGKHVRPFELAMQLSKDAVLEFKRGKPLYLLRFKTNEKVVFKRFTFTEEFKQIMNSFKFVRDRVRKSQPLSFYYKLSSEYKLKKQLLKLAKQNAID